MLTTIEEIDALTEALEVWFLANRDNNLHFGLLTDFPDAPQETMPGDAALLAHASARITALNDRYVTNDGNDADRFFLFHRPRRWNDSERIWMGYERKRGKIPLPIRTFEPSCCKSAPACSARASANDG